MGRPWTVLVLDVVLLLLPSVTRRVGAFSLCMFYFQLSVRVVPHGTKGTSPMVRHETSVFEIPQNRNDTVTVSISTICVYCICPLHIRHVGFAHHRALQTSWRGLGWLQGSTRNGMYRGRAHSTGGSSQQGLLPEVYRTASTGEVSSPTTECSTSYGTKNPTTKQLLHTRPWQYI